jgi:hypothetical protein
VSSLEQDGYVTTSVLDAVTIARLRAEFDALGVDDVSFYASSVDADRDTAMRLHRVIREAVEPCLQGVLPGWKGFLGAFLSKSANTENVLALHQDWTYVDEAEHRSYIAWCPLIDTTVETGTLHVVPGSHRWLSDARGSGFPSPFRDVEQLLLDEALVALPLPAGDAVIYDAALLHASPPNRSGAVRPVAGLAMAPPGVALVHHHTEGDGTATVHEIDEWYYTRQEFATAPTGYRVIGTHPVVDRPVTEAQVRAWLA